MKAPPIPKPDLDQTRRFLSAIVEPSVGCCELRVLHASFDRQGFVVAADQYSRTLAGWYDDIDKLIVDTGRLRGISGYVTVNPIKNDLLSRSDNRLIKAKHTSSDSDVVCLRWLYVDIDPIRPADISSTDEEFTAAVGRRDLILDEHPDIRRSAMWGKSGNGAWILVRMADYSNDPPHAKAVESTLKGISRRYTDQSVKIDTSTFNPARIMCIPGLIKCKGSNRTERPWRMTTLDNELDDNKSDSKSDEK